MHAFVKLVLTSLCLQTVVIGQIPLSEKDLTVLGVPADTMMRSYLTNIVDLQFVRRDSILSTFRSAKDWDAHAHTIRDSMISWTGTLPKRTPLNARVTGRIEKADYVIERTIFESRPGFLVSANLYLPKNIKGPHPAHLNVIGHAQDGKANERYQRMSIAQVKNGFVVLTMDLLGQGERGKLSTHKIIGTQAFISGTHIFNIMVWDAIRAIDYLVSRPEVDPERICMTGSSGGGMMTTYILPFDDRIKVAVPTCNPNTWSYRVHANLATDHEQVFFGAFESSIDPRSDPLFVQVPKPLLINATTDDNLNPPRGVWDLSTWLYKSYAAHNVPEKFTTTMIKAGHDYNQEQREITYAWMSRWTAATVPSFSEEKITIEREEDLWATQAGSVFHEPGSREAKELVLDYLSDRQARWEKIDTETAVEDHKSKMTALVEEVLNMNFENVHPICDFLDRRRVGDVEIRPFVLTPESGILLPGVLLHSATTAVKRDMILYLHEKGKQELLEDADVVEGMLDDGHSFCLVDLRGMGETSPDMADKFWDFLIGKPIFGQRVKDVLAIVTWLKDSVVETRDIKLWGVGMCALYGAFAGAISDDVAGFVFEEPLLSFESVVKVTEPKFNHEVLLPGVLEKFDLTQIYQALCPQSVLVMNPLLGDKLHADGARMERISSEVLRTYRGSGRQEFWNMSHVPSDERGKIISEWLD
ncbi:MAG: prolyl oligopeptidase family serine peptidase [Saprospiraceae bacterium]|nr:prolyl oligopeptidase family serine peptidase [Saprospiraceae bacterium]